MQVHGVMITSSDTIGKRNYHCKCMVLSGEDDATTQCLKELLPVVQHVQRAYAFIWPSGAPSVWSKDVAREAVGF